MNDTTGQITAIAAVDYEQVTTKTLFLKIKIQDGGNRSTTATVVVAVGWLLTTLKVGSGLENGRQGQQIDHLCEFKKKWRFYLNRRKVKFK